MFCISGGGGGGGGGAGGVGICGMAGMAGICISGILGGLRAPPPPKWQRHVRSIFER
jgi:hypothetical protein